MYLSEKLSHYIASKIANTLSLDQDRKEIIAYGAFSLIHTVWSILLIVIFALIFDVLLSALVVSLTSVLLRKYSGGAHATSPNRCAVIGAIVFVGAAVLIDRLVVQHISMVLLIPYMLASFALAYYFVNRYCPVDTPNKPITKTETKLRLRRGAFFILHLNFAVVMMLTVVCYPTYSIMIRSILLSVCTGLLWQALTLTALGHLMIHQLDVCLKCTISFMGGEKQ